MTDCIFCAIAAREVPAIVVDEDTDTIAFMDSSPWQRGHALVVPRRHYEHLLEVEPDDLTRVMAAAKRLAARMKERLEADGIVLWNSCGPAAGQVVMHFHIHVIPIAGQAPTLPPRSPRQADETELVSVAKSLRGCS